MTEPNEVAELAEGDDRGWNWLERRLVWLLPLFLGYGGFEAGGPWWSNSALMGLGFFVGCAVVRRLEWAVGRCRERQAPRANQPAPGGSR